jgi:hypothetical protein
LDHHQFIGFRPEGNPQPVDATFDELLDALRLAERRGQLDRVRRIESDLAHLGRVVRTYELAPSWIGGGR